MATKSVGLYSWAVLAMLLSVYIMNQVSALQEPRAKRLADRYTDAPALPARPGGGRARGGELLLVVCGRVTVTPADSDTGAVRARGDAFISASMRQYQHPNLQSELLSREIAVTYCKRYGTA